MTTLAEEFRLFANEIVDMLDGRIPVVSRLKVCRVLNLFDYIQVSQRDILQVSSYLFLLVFCRTC